MSEVFSKCISKEHFAFVLPPKIGYSLNIAFLNYVMQRTSCAKKTAEKIQVAS